MLSIFGNRQFVIALCTICVSYPLSLYRDIHKLSRASGLALLSMIIIVSSVLIRAPQSPAELKGDSELRFAIIQPGIFQAIGVISFAFVCHHNSLLIYGSMKTPTIDRFTLVTHVSTLFSLLSCCVLAISAFWVFTNKTQGNILNNFPAVNNSAFANSGGKLMIYSRVIPSLILPVSALGSTCLLLYHWSCLFAEKYGRASLVDCDVN